MSRYIKDSAGKLVKFADKFLKMANHIYNEGIYYLRVKAGGGTVTNREMVEDIYKVYEENNMLDNIRVGVLAQAGGVQRTSGIYRFFSKLFTLRTDANDVIQSTANSQPYFVNGALVNPNGGSRFMTHPTVSFAANEAWSVSWVMNSNWGSRTAYYIFGDGPANTSYFGITSNGVYRIVSAGQGINFGSNGNRIAGKSSYWNLIYNGTGTVSLYRDTVLIYSASINGAFNLNSFILGSGASQSSEGSHYSYFIRSGALTPSQITAEYTVLRKYFPEIRTTLIGGKEIATENCQMVATPMGRVISLNNTAGNVNGIAGGDFEGGLIGVKSTDGNEVSIWTLNNVSPISGTQDGRLRVTTVGTLERPFINFTTTGRLSGQLRRTFFQYKVNSGNVLLKYIRTGSSLASIEKTLTGIGFFEYYYICDGTSNCIITFDGTKLFDLQVDNIKDELVGWNDAKNYYDWVYTNTSGTASQKTSAALAAAAMWRSPDADHDKQAVFGKVFNKFATKLMAFDIAAYNTANPSTPWGYHVMTRAESLAMQSLDADTLKATGTDYWTSANGTNTTGLNLLGSGVINADGTYSDFKGKTRLMTDDDYAIDINDDGTSTEISVTTEGGILRLVKD